ncbi:hypothetical protein F2P79_025964, partial [Pimephales promelas]
RAHSPTEVCPDNRTAGGDRIGQEGTDYRYGEGARKTRKPERLIHLLDSCCIRLMRTGDLQVNKAL